jgi:alkylated DNA repair dioxygenase AlkB
MERIVDKDGYAILIQHFLPAEVADSHCRRLLHEVQWREEHYTIYGKRVTAPRLVAWYGDPQATYNYSGISHIPLPWSPLLTDLKSQIEQVSNHTFNSVLCNLYRTGQDSMGWHADKEPELGNNPYIASLSLGEARVFKLRHNKTKQIIEMVLESGSLLLMGGELQHHWRHSVPKTTKVNQPRINLTFRKIFPKPSSQ